jgi:hypothetical protein
VLVGVHVGQDAVDVDHHDAVFVGAVVNAVVTAAVIGHSVCGSQCK